MQAIKDLGQGEAGAIERLIVADGTARHPHRAALATDPHARDLADLVHALCAVHGDHDGPIDGAAAQALQPEAAGWLEDTARGMAAERAFLAVLVAAAGPLPSTPGQAETQAALVAQRRALDLLARSDRTGCATGTVAALLAEWLAHRPLLERAAERFGVEAPAPDLPDPTEPDRWPMPPALARAAAFGAQQALAQSRGFWSLMEARAAARA